MAKTVRFKVGYAETEVEAEERMRWELIERRKRKIGAYLVKNGIILRKGVDKPLEL